MSYRVYFGRLPDTLSQDDFEKLIGEHGKAKNIEWKSGYAYVDYKHGSDASNTVQNLNGKEIGGNNILVELARNGVGGYSIAGGFTARMKTPLPRPVRTPHRVRIENLSTRAKWMELKELLSLAGEVTFADTHKRKQGEGIVEFATKKDLTEAIKTFDKTSFFGRTIRLYDESPRSRSRSGGYRESRSRSRSPRRRSSPASKDRKKHSRSKSPNRKALPSKHRSASRKIRSNSASPHRRSRKHKRSKSQSYSPPRRASRKHEGRSMTPVKSSRHSQKKSKKSKRDMSHSRSKSPKRKKKHRQKRHSEKRKRKRSYSSSSSESDITLKRKAKSANKKKPSSSSSESKTSSDSSSSSSEDSESDNRSK